MTWRVSGKKRTVHGFSLLELLVVIAIIGLVAGVTATRLSSSSESTLLKTETRKLLTHMRAIRGRAISESTTYSLTTVNMEHTYTVRPEETLFELPESLSITILPAHTQTLVDPAISFYPDGSTNGGSIAVAGSTGQHTILINWITGEVSLAPGA